MTMAPRKRIYKQVSVASTDGGFAVLLDGRMLKSPAKADMVMPTRALADAVAAEWQAQGATIVPHTMPMTQLASTMLDRVAARRAEMVEMVLKFGETDLLCYRAEDPTELVARQDRLWQPLLDWAEIRFGAGLAVTRGVLPIAQPTESLAALRRAAQAFDDGHLTVLQSATATFGSLVLALALLERRLTTEEAFAASQVDETFQAEFWGEDYEAKDQREARAADIKAAGRFLDLLRE